MEGEANKTGRKRRFAGRKLARTNREDVAETASRLEPRTQGIPLSLSERYRRGAKNAHTRIGRTRSGSEAEVERRKERSFERDPSNARRLLPRRSGRRPSPAHFPRFFSEDEKKNRKKKWEDEKCGERCSVGSKEARRSSVTQLTTMFDAQKRLSTKR